MKTLGYSILVILTLFSGKFACSETFEGIVIYELEYTDLDPGWTKDIIYKHHGDSMIYYHDDTAGHLNRFFNKGESVKTDWFKSSNNMVYGYLEWGDTLFSYSAKDTSYDINIIETETTEIICGYNCKKVIADFEPRPGVDLPGGSCHYYLTTDLTINTKPYNDFLDGGYSDVLKIQPGVLLKYVFFGPFFTETRTATKVRRTKVDINHYIPKQFKNTEKDKK